jgi:hypothetical protein
VIPSEPTISIPPPQVDLNKNGVPFIMFITGVCIALPVYQFPLGLTFENQINSNAEIAKDMSELSNSLQNQMNTLSAALTSAINTVAASVLLPGVAYYSFSSMRLTPEGHVAIDVDYLDDDCPVNLSVLQQPAAFPSPWTPITIPIPGKHPASNGTGSASSGKNLTLTSRSELIEYQTTAQYLGRRSRITAVSDSSGNPVVLSISDTGRLELVSNDMSGGNGWKITDISPQVDHASVTVQVAAAYQGMYGLIYIAAAIAIAPPAAGSPSAPSLVYTAIVDWTQVGKLNQLPWELRPMPIWMSGVSIGKFIWGGATIGEPKPILMATTLGSTSVRGWSTFAEHYAIDISPQVTDMSKIWSTVPMPLNSTEIRDMVLGVDAIGDKGVYCLFTNGPSTELFFTSFPDEFGKCSHEPLDCRTGDQVLLSIPRNDGKTTLFVGGADGIFEYSVGNQSRGHNPACIANSRDISAPISDLQGHITDNCASIWALDRSSNLLHITGEAFQGVTIGPSWNTNLRFRSAVAAFSPIYNHQREVDELILLSNNQEENLTHMYRTSASGTFTTQEIMIPDDSTPLSMTTYTTIVLVADEKGLPAAGVLVYISTIERSFVVVNDMYLQLDWIPVEVSTDMQGHIKLVFPTSTLQAPTYTFHFANLTATHDPTSKITAALSKVRYFILFVVLVLIYFIVYLC